MANPVVPLKIGTDVFMVPPPSGMRSFALQQRIIPIASRLVNVLLHLVGTKDTEQLLEQDVTAVLPKALPYLGSLFQDMPHGELEAITKELLADASLNKQKLFDPSGANLFDDLMKGRTIDTWLLLWHALKVWYPDFFVKGASFLGRGAKGNPSEEPKESTTNGPALDS